MHQASCRIARWLSRRHRTKNALVIPARIRPGATLVAGNRQAQAVVRGAGQPGQ